MKSKVNGHFRIDEQKLKTWCCFDHDVPTNDGIDAVLHEQWHVRPTFCDMYLCWWGTLLRCNPWRRALVSELPTFVVFARCEAHRLTCTCQ